MVLEAFKERFGGAAHGILAVNVSATSRAFAQVTANMYSAELPKSESEL